MGWEGTRQLEGMASRHINLRPKPGWAVRPCRHQGEELREADCGKQCLGVPKLLTRVRASLALEIVVCGRIFMDGRILCRCVFVEQLEDLE